ncbi:6,7-dimethyl-8-ribityllumazine synthase [Allocoleopsis franciscana]|uniref:6,7-dimethyl-8-ribityllumazine synthase n=1 Tax=Allocoleopsis franciscana PCC 7113 TaxID=1173027 RepID=K9WD63_9CYAN|nr:6,7-dimethyl-8-ribityllumazine synthase [Allocoleopsis franciscana PCC 7113]
MAVFEGTFTSSKPLRFAIIIGRFNDLVTGKLLTGCEDCLKRHGVDTNPHGTQVDYIWVPGAFEVPLMARQAAITGRYDAVICLGAVIRGQTPHFDYVAAEVAKGIASAGAETGVPVIFGVVTADTMQQALERAGIKSNKGWDYALNALEMASLMQHFKGNGIASTYATYEENAVTPQALPISSNRTITSEARVEHQPSAE